MVESRAGANTIIAANACKAAPPDGYTICLLSRSSVSINPALYKNLSYDPLKDFEPITNLAFAQQVLILNKNVPVKRFQGAGGLFEDRTRTSSTSARSASAATPTWWSSGSSTRPARR